MKQCIEARRHRAVNAFCIDVDDLLRAATATTATAQSDKGTYGCCNGGGVAAVQWSRGDAASAAVLPPMSPADPVVLNEVLRHPARALRTQQQQQQQQQQQHALPLRTRRRQSCHTRATTTTTRQQDNDMDSDNVDAIAAYATSTAAANDDAMHDTLQAAAQQPPLQQQATQRVVWEQNGVRATVQQLLRHRAPVHADADTGNNNNSNNDDVDSRPVAPLSLCAHPATLSRAAAAMASSSSGGSCGTRIDAYDKYTHTHNKNNAGAGYRDDGAAPSWQLPLQQHRHDQHVALSSSRYTHVCQAALAAPRSTPQQQQTSVRPLPVLLRGSSTADKRTTSGAGAGGGVARSSPPLSSCATRPLLRSTFSSTLHGFAPVHPLTRVLPGPFRRQAAVAAAMHTSATRTRRPKRR